ncbi:ATP-binding cassette domain-containing protein [Paenibacillus sp. D2_2]|uniref:ATP-binding cassette domain-containing protein n=1 Tax=Paenibacillus sp. D2_2 TaxID=3073092 RepID=UPI0028153BC1|nr:ATP-binding cassette domain-containing protein [Paenibacillus sp. D2_2]WMT43121.1 ATP-binding cassette domain-containing protein [Paenibacillus sp. D2_2]
MKQVSVSFAGRKALHNVSCSIQNGKWISVIGQTGAGKSTFAKLLKGLISDYEGEYLINQQPLPRDRKGQVKVASEIGFVFQYPEHQIFETTVYNELAFALKIMGYSSEQIAEQIDYILPQFGLSSDILPLSPFQLSGGLKRRIALASVLMMEPKLLILDEPTAGLDPLSRDNLLNMLKEWQWRNNSTVLFISHRMEDVAQYSDEVMVFRGGHLLGHYDASELFLRNRELVEEAGLLLPEAVQLLGLIEQLSGQKIEVASCREQDILRKVLPIWQARGHLHGK